MTSLLALAVYDFLFSFPGELKYIWNRKFGTGTALYVSIRYGALIHMLLAVIGATFVPKAIVVSSVIL